MIGSIVYYSDNYIDGDKHINIDRYSYYSDNYIDRADTVYYSDNYIDGRYSLLQR